MKKIKDYIFKFLYALPFGLKKADSEILGNSSNNGANGIVINQQVEDKTVAKHLLKGEVTQAVEELRYRTYKVDEESRNYEYLGNGVAVKKDEQVPKNRTRFRFTQRNKIITTGVLEELERVGSYGQDTYVLEIMYSSFPRFRLEEFADRIMVDANTKTNEYLTTLVFSTIPSQYQLNSKSFIVELNKLANIDLNSQYAVEHNDFLSTIQSISFSTYRSNNEEDFTNYSFIGKCTPTKVEFKNQECHITYSWSEMLRSPLEKLSKKYSSSSMEDKYSNQTEKKIDPMIEEWHQTYHCEMCGKEYTQSKIPGICDECYEKLKNN